MGRSNINFRLLVFGLVVPFFFLLLFPSYILSAPKSDKQAVKIVNRWLAQTPMPLGSKLKADVGSVETHTNVSGEHLYYIVHINPKGFIVVSADDLIEPIIGFFPNADSFSPLSSNPLGAMLKYDMPNRMESVRSNSKSLISGKKYRSDLPKRQKKANDKWNELLAETPPKDLKATGLPDTSIDDIRVSPFVESRWSQSTEGGEYCYNYYTPNHYVCGCTATAMAQVMRYHQHPHAGVGTPSFSIEVDTIIQSANLRGGDGAGGPYAWSDMVLDPTNTITETERQAIGALHYDAGVSVEMSYTSGGSAGSIQYAADRLVDTFGYATTSYGAHYDQGWQNMTSSQIEKMINTNLDAGLPVILHISGDGGHAILADGYGTNNSTVYHHINMGWAGFDDGWYNIPDIQATNYIFSVVIEVVYNIFKQNDGEIVSGRIVDDDGIPMQGVLVTATDGVATYTDTTDSRGVFALANVPSATSFIVTSSKAGYTFLPAQRNVTTATSANNGYWLTDWPTSGNVWGIDFIGAIENLGDIDGSGQRNLAWLLLLLK